MILENKTSNKITKPKPIKTKKEKKENTATVMEVLMKAEAEQTNSISSGWKRELLHYNMREDLPEKKHLSSGQILQILPKLALPHS